MAAPALVATPGAADANSYLTLAEAEAYANSDIDAAEWYTSTADQKTRALITATRNLDMEGFVGTRTNATQALAWPRTGVPSTEKTYTSTEIPTEIKLATWQIANSLIRGVVIGGQAAGSQSLLPGIPNAGLKRVKLDVMEVEWKPDQPPNSLLKVLPQLQKLLQDLLLNPPGQTIPVVRS